MRKILGTIILVLLFFPSTLLAYEEGDITFGPTPGLAARGAIKGGGLEFYYFTSPKLAVGPTVNYLMYTLEFDDGDEYETTTIPAQFGARYFFYDIIFLGFGGYYSFHRETDIGDSTSEKTEYNTYGPYVQFGFVVDFKNFYFELYSQFNWSLNPYLKVGKKEYYQRYGIAQIGIGVKI